MGKKSLKLGFYLLFALSLVSIVGLSYFTDITERSPLVLCQSWWAFPPTKEVRYYTTPEKIIIKPWLGQHHVYGVFMIPTGYRYDYLFKLSLPGENTRCGAVQPTSESLVPDVDVKPGYYLLKGYLNTRIALRLIFQGHLNQLKQPENWKLGYFKPRKKSVFSKKHTRNTGSNQTSQ
ncbi:MULTISPECIES: hypothetical protein [unclassified Anabaena]|uniref:hypothetical protein n=1 Tax=unclassified Anabaena TaxID=2619674 RepID=UPI000A667417|nr:MULTISPECIES: hypothetical protein [unclassified Anabaena]